MVFIRPACPAPALSGLLTLCLLILPFGAMGDTDTGTARDDWSGIWAVDMDEAEFSLRVIRTGNQFRVQAVAPLDVLWESRSGVIHGDTGTIEVEYEGVVARVMVQLTSPTTAIVRPLSCQPDFHVICTLVRNQQAKFVKIP